MFVTSSDIRVCRSSTIGQLRSPLFKDRHTRMFALMPYTRKNIPPSEVPTPGYRKLSTHPHRLLCSLGLRSGLQCVSKNETHCAHLSQEWRFFSNGETLWWYGRMNVETIASRRAMEKGHALMPFFHRGSAHPCVRSFNAQC